jgi:hypothetical protein
MRHDFGYRTQLKLKLLTNNQSNIFSIFHWFLDYMRLLEQNKGVECDWWPTDDTDEYKTEAILFSYLVEIVTDNL